MFRNLGTDDSIYSGLICRKVLVCKSGGLLKILKRVYGWFDECSAFYGNILSIFSWVDGLSTLSVTYRQINNYFLWLRLGVLAIRKHIFFSQRCILLEGSFWKQCVLFTMTVPSVRDLQSPGLAQASRWHTKAETAYTGMPATNAGLCAGLGSPAAIDQTRST